jgi:hypothetical protein
MIFKVIEFEANYKEVYRLTLNTDSWRENIQLPSSLPASTLRETPKTYNMAVRGQRFELDLDADDFSVGPTDNDDLEASGHTPVIGEIQEHESSTPPPAPALKVTKSGFPDHKPRRKPSAFKQRQQTTGASRHANTPTHYEPSDRAITHQLGKKYGVNLDAKEKAEISDENKRRLAEMSVEDVEDARSELLKSLNPAFLERLLKRANIEEDQPTADQWQGEPGQETDDHVNEPNNSFSQSDVHNLQTSTTLHNDNNVHFPTPPRSKDDYVPLNSEDPKFLSDLKTHYFPNTPHDPSTLSWLQDPTDAENEDSLYNPEKEAFYASALRFGFNGRLIPPRESLEIDVSKGLHHHGEAPNSAGYTIPELAMLSRSTLPNQRCMAYQLLGRILYRLGRGDFGERGSELQEGLWSVIEHERPIEVMMSEANRQGGHASAKAYAVESLWLWKKGGGGDRGVLKPGQSLGR